jgi:hypothetical protein
MPRRKPKFSYVLPQVTMRSKKEFHESPAELPGEVVELRRLYLKLSSENVLRGVAPDDQFA